MAALLVGLSIMSVLMSVAMPVWSHMAKREREEELIWRGQQYARAVGLFQRKYANTFPPTLDILVEQKFLRKKYKDPITNDDFQLIPAGGAAAPGMIVGPQGGLPGSNQPAMLAGRGGQPPTTAVTQTSPTAAPAGTATAITPGANLNLGISGVVSKSKDTSIKIYNGRQRYNEWAFVYLQTTQTIGAPGAAGPMAPGGRGGFPGAPGRPMPMPMPGRGFGPFGPGAPGLPGGAGGMPPLPPGRGFQPINPQGPQGQPLPFGMPQGPPPGGTPPVQPFGKPPGS